ncbi:MAG: hypothetical protein JWN71_4171 [Xanthobacteraceae bacterium]|nr:hypothetical protein [Xanthobacteraceae bacterium]
MEIEKAAEAKAAAAREAAKAKNDRQFMIALVVGGTLLCAFMFFLGTRGFAP